MHPVVNHLVQLQELIQVRDMQKVMRGGKHLDELNASIKGMIAKLPTEAREHFEKLHNKGQATVVPVSEAVCSGCGMALPSSLVQLVRQAKQVQYCPNCARVLYYVGLAARRLSHKRRRTGPQKAGVARFSAKSLMLPDVESATPEGVIREIATQMEAEGFIHGAEMLVETALQREAILSTAVDHTIAFPHARGVEGGGLTMAVAISRKGIKWDPDAKERTRLIFFVVIPTAASAFYLNLVAGLAETFMDAEARKALLAEETPESLWKVLAKLTRKTIK